MNITVNFKENIECKILHLTFACGSGKITFTSKHQFSGIGTCEMENVSYDNAENIDRIEHMDLVEMLLLMNGKRLFWTEILSIIINDDKGCSYAMLPARYSKYQYREINEPNFFFKLIEADYQKLAAYVRHQDKIENATDALANYDEVNKNVVEYILNNDITYFSDFFDELRDYTGEEEYWKINEYINEKRGGMVYPIFISNKGTEDEIHQVVPMLRMQYEKICEDMREYWNGDAGPEEWGSSWPILYDEDGGLIDLKYVTEITEV